MALVLSEEQEILKRTAREFVSGRSSLKRVRALRDDREGEGFDAALWAEMAGLGWLGIVIPEAYGGLELGFTEQMVVLEELGRGLCPEPIVGTVLLGAMAVLLGGSEGQKEAILPAVVAGERFLALGYQEPGSRYDPTRVATRAERAGSGWRLTGEKLGVVDGQAADHVIVSARTDGEVDDAGGITLFLVRSDAPGVTLERQHRIDGRGAARLVLESVTVSSDALLGTEGTGAAVLGRVLDRATIGLTAEMLGSMCVAFETTLDYLKTREQFGRPIGAFQALKHRAARLFIETELARSIVMEAHAALDRGADDAEIARLASAAKTRCSDAFMLIGNEAVQMHGGIGMTDEHDIGLFLKRARAAEIQFGDAAYHRDRVATLDGY